MDLSWIDRLLEKKPIIFIDQMLFRFKNDDVVGIGAQMSYFLILSFFPFLIALLNIVKFTPIADVDVLSELIKVLPLSTQNAIITIVSEMVETSSQIIVPLALAGGIWAAASAMYFIIKSINRAYGYKETRTYFKITFLSVIFTIGLLLLIVLVFITLVFGELIGEQIFSYFGRSDIFYIIWSYFRGLISLFYMILTFALLYKYSPNKKKGSEIRLIDTLPGAIFTSLGWMITSMLFSAYVNNFDVFTIAYGSLGAVIVLLTWLFISGIFMILGGEINATIEFFKINGFKYHPQVSYVQFARDRYFKKKD